MYIIFRTLLREETNVRELVALFADLPAFLMLVVLYCHYDYDFINVTQCFLKGHTALHFDPLMFDSGKHKACLFDTVVKLHSVKIGRLTETRESLTVG